MKNNGLSRLNGTLKGALIKAGLAVVVAILGYFYATLQRHERFVVSTEVHIQKQTEEMREVRAQLREIERLLRER